ncbi:MAG: 23S rRNA (adenine(2503)-C(2))-methyltransferase RlmN [Spirochaetaceae bacterium]|nr:23S rRNA (adenine(2503)-C(2))-methyltransferase RlmN [Spirochaetaceae bacterium]
MLSSITGLLPQEIAEKLELDASFRGRQIFKWIAQGAETFDDMTNLSKDLRSRLKEASSVYSTRIKQTLTDPDGTIKLQIELHDGRFVETVLLTDAEGRKTACVSCQAGCGMNCAFCQTGRLGFGRNLEAGEIVEQFLHLERKTGKLDNIVFMGMGEPMLNLDAIRKTIEILGSENGRNLSKRRITLSTSGIIPGIYDLADNGPAIRLAVSLTTANEELRKQLMPVTNANPLQDLRKAIKYYTEKTGIRCTLEAALMHDVNTDDKAADELIAFARGIDVHFNLIPWNPVESLPFKEPSRQEVNHLMERLEKGGISATLRTRRGRSIGGACGQLGKSQTENGKN